jgi:hypothetical protein
MTRLCRYHRDSEHEEYAEHIMSILFPNQMFFTKNKRLNNDEDRAKLVQLKEDIFNEDL